MCCLLCRPQTRVSTGQVRQKVPDTETFLFLCKHARHQPPSATSGKQFTYAKKGDFCCCLPASYSLQLPLRSVGLIYINIDYKYRFSLFFFQSKRLIALEVLQLSCCSYVKTEILIFTVESFV